MGNSITSPTVLSEAKTELKRRGYGQNRVGYARRQWQCRGRITSSQYTLGDSVWLQWQWQGREEGSRAGPDLHKARILGFFLHFIISLPFLIRFGRFLRSRFCILNLFMMVLKMDNGSLMNFRFVDGRQRHILIFWILALVHLQQHLSFILFGCFCMFWE